MSCYYVNMTCYYVKRLCYYVKVSWYLVNRNVIMSNAHVIMSKCHAILSIWRVIMLNDHVVLWLYHLVKQVWYFIHTTLCCWRTFIGAKSKYKMAECDTICGGQISAILFQILKPYVAGTLNIGFSHKRDIVGGKDQFTPSWFSSLGNNSSFLSNVAGSAGCDVGRQWRIWWYCAMNRLN